MTFKVFIALFTVISKIQLNANYSLILLYTIKIYLLNIFYDKLFAY